MLDKIADFLVPKTPTDAVLGIVTGVTAGAACFVLAPASLTAALAGKVLAELATTSVGFIVGSKIRQVFVDSSDESETAVPGETINRDEGTAQKTTDDSFEVICDPLLKNETPPHDSVTTTTTQYPQASTVKPEEKTSSEDPPIKLKTFDTPKAATETKIISPPINSVTNVEPKHDTPPKPVVISPSTSTVQKSSSPATANKTDKIQTSIESSVSKTISHEGKVIARPPEPAFKEEFAADDDIRIIPEDKLIESEQLMPPLPTIPSPREIPSTPNTTNEQNVILEQSITQTKTTTLPSQVTNTVVPHPEIASKPTNNPAVVSSPKPNVESAIASAKALTESLVDTKTKDDSQKTTIQTSTIKPPEKENEPNRKDSEEEEDKEQVYSSDEEDEELQSDSSSLFLCSSNSEDDDPTNPNNTPENHWWRRFRDRLIHPLQKRYPQQARHQIQKTLRRIVDDKLNEIHQNRVDDEIGSPRVVDALQEALLRQFTEATETHDALVVMMKMIGAATAEVCTQDIPDEVGKRAQQKLRSSTGNQSLATTARKTEWYFVKKFITAMLTTTREALTDRQNTQETNEIAEEIAGTVSSAINDAVTKTVYQWMVGDVRTHQFDREGGEEDTEVWKEFFNEMIREFEIVSTAATECSADATTTATKAAVVQSKQPDEEE